MEDPEFKKEDLAWLDEEFVLVIKKKQNTRALGRRRQYHLIPRWDNMGKYDVNFT